MLSLLIETSTERGCVAIMQNTEVLFHHELPFGYQNSKYLIPVIEQAFKATGLAMKDLAFIAAGVGPGSYTGIRVGAIVAKTLVFAHQIPLVGICSLHGFLPASECSFTALIDAKIGGAYCLQGLKNAHSTEWTSLPQAIPLDQLGLILSETKIIVSPHSLQIKGKMDRLYPENQWIWEEKGPDPIQMTSLALAKMKNGEYSLNGDLDLLYLRKTQAEIERDLLKSG